MLCVSISGKSFEAQRNMLRGIDHDSIHLQQFHATCDAQLFQYTRCDSVACYIQVVCYKLHHVWGALGLKYVMKYQGGFRSQGGALGLKYVMKYQGWFRSQICNEIPGGL